jgi:hypothetical protein
VPALDHRTRHYFEQTASALSATDMHTSNFALNDASMATSSGQGNRLPVFKQWIDFSRKDLPSAIIGFVSVRPEGACHQRRRVPPRELSIDLVADERLGRATGSGLFGSGKGQSEAVPRQFIQLSEPQRYCLILRCVLPRIGAWSFRGRLRLSQRSRCR